MRDALLLDVALVCALAGLLSITVFRAPADRLGRARRAELRKNRYTLPGDRS